MLALLMDFRFDLFPRFRSWIGRRFLRLCLLVWRGYCFVPRFLLVLIVRHKFQPLGFDGTLMALRIQRGLLALLHGLEFF